MIGSSRIAPALRAPSAQRQRTGQLERHRRAVDVVIAAVGERDFDVDQREAGEDAALARLLDALLDGGDELLAGSRRRPSRWSNENPLPRSLGSRR